jgi:phage repressor protein C with HTH and peptisase S24 domain
MKVRVDARLLRERIHNGFQSIKIASVSGDSMEPTLSHGDQVLIDTSYDRFVENAIYAIQQDGFLRFKRIQLKLDGSITVKSDGYPDVESYSAEETALFIVVGIVIPFKFGRFEA